MNRKIHRPRIGVFGIGLAAYWPQFPGLKERLESYQGIIENRLRDNGTDVISAGLIDTAQQAAFAGQTFAASNLDLLFCYVGTYATSSQMLPVVQRSKVPVIVLNLQPSASLDYEKAGEQQADLVKVDIMLQGEPVDAFSAIRHKDDAYTYGTMMTAKLRELIPRQQFEVPIQAAIGSRIIARENIRAVRKDVLAKCYGGDITRKRKLLEKQKEGKKRMKTIGRVEVPQEAFVAALSTGSSPDKAKK